MQTPPPVSGEAYPTQVRSETRSNYISGGLSVNTAYTDNLYAGGTEPPTGETTITFLPTISFDETTDRQQRRLTYSPGYTIYQPSSELNQTYQNVTGSYLYRISPVVSVSADDAFVRSSGAFGTGTSYTGSVSGSPQPSAVGVIAPFVQQLSNTAAARLTMQVSRSGMIGFSGTDTILNFPNVSNSSGLFDSDSRGGSAFYNRRIAAGQYFGATYQYWKSTTSPAAVASDTQTHTISGFYTIYLTKNLSMSISGGPQYFQVSEVSLPASSSWSPSFSASTGWQGNRTSFAASYSRHVGGGGGLFGAFHSTGASGTAHWQIARAWSVGAGANYSLNKSITQLSSLGNENGHSVSGIASVDHAISQHLRMTFLYDRLHQSYGGISAVAANPNADQETLSISWQFMRPLGQ